MRLPNLENAIIDEEKLREYLLSERHPIGKSKAIFFRLLGFDENHVEAFQKELVRLVNENDVVEMIETDYGTKYVIDGVIYGIQKQNARIRTIWIIENYTSTPRFVTAYPRLF